MKRTPLDSTLVQAVSHDPETKTVHVELLHKGTYTYHDVPDEDVKALIAAESAGKHFNTVFKAAHGHKARKAD
jgi:hypothetical protein